MANLKREIIMIKFGTSGWRGIIAKDFTYDKVAFASQAIVNIINEDCKKENESVIIGYDTRFMSEDFAKTSAEIFAGNGINVLFCKRDTPTPVIAYEIINSKLIGGINFTASHNHYQYNGLKYSSSWGGSALPETTKKIEKYCASLRSKDIKYMLFETGIKNKIIKIYNPRNSYIKKIKELVNFKALKKAQMKVAVDILHGTGHDYLDTMLDMAGIKNTTINKSRDVMFNNGAPEPSENNLKGLVNLVKKELYKLGLSIDGDADRFGIIDSNGAFISPNQIISILLYHLNKTRGWTGIVAKSIMTTSLIDKLAKKIGVRVEETPVGFKYIGDIMVNNPDEFIIGGEESGGLTIRGHVPEKDGILACLLVAEAVAMNKKSLTEILKDIKKITGEVVTSRLNFYLDTKVMESFKDKLKNKALGTFAGIKIKKYVNIDGYKFILDENSWIGFRLSGTEPVIRLYAESDSQSKLKKILKDGKEFVYGK